MKTARFVCVAAVLAVGGFLAVRTQDVPQKRVGPLPDGAFLLSTGWTIRPAGQQTPVDTFPISCTLSANGKFLLVLNSGYNQPAVSVIDVASRKEIGRTKLPDGWLGLVATANDRVYVGGGGQGTVYELSLNPDTGALTQARTLAASPNAPSAPFIGDVAVSADGHTLYAADVMNDRIAVLDPQSGQVVATWKCGRRPYRILIVPSAQAILVSSWADASVYAYNWNNGKELSRTRVGPHPTDMLLLEQPPPTEEGETSTYKARLFVAAANTNNVYALGMTADGQLNMLESINVSMTPLHPLGMTPSALALSKDGSQLYVVCSDANAVAVADISAAHTSVRGFVPTAWYPTAVRALSDGTLAIVNGKGMGSRANPDGPNPTRHFAPIYPGGPIAAPGYIPHIQTGTVQFVSQPSSDEIRDYTAQCLRNSPYHDEMIYGGVTSDAEAYFARAENHPSPIQHAIYIIKENRTYDQVLGDIPKANGDPSLTLFGEDVTPNLHQLAREFITYDNFYENADVSAEGHNFANAAIAPDYTVKTWPENYAGRKKEYDYEGGEPANTPPAGYIWSNALQAGLTVRDYGEWTTNINPAPQSGQQIAKALDPSLNGHVDLNYRGWDLTYQDVDRAHEFIREWKEFESQGNAPNLMIVRLGNDHTEALKPGALTPAAHVADNDSAVGQLVDAVSHSKLWSSTAIFIIEDDAQNGPDHVDSHRAPAWVISPYTHRGIVDSTFYNQMSVLRTIELLLGLRPLTHYDAGATPMFQSFSREPNETPYTAIPPKTSTTARNPADGPGVDESRRMDFSAPDLVDDDVLTSVVWTAVKHSPVPPPTRSAFAR